MEVHFSGMGTQKSLLLVGNLFVIAVLSCNILIKFQDQKIPQKQLKEKMIISISMSK
jgi:hypothetical protein